MGKKEEGMFDSNRCSWCNNFGEKAKPYICINCQKKLDQLINSVKENKLTKCLFQRKGWRSYAVYYNNIHILETMSLSRAIDLFKSL